MVFKLPRFRIPIPVVVPDSAAATSRAPERGHWGTKAEFILSCVGMSVGMGNVWRFPYQAFHNGGAAFLFPYLITIIIVGAPMYYAECILGQFTSLGPMGCYTFCPPFKGAGIAASFISLLVALYYNMFMVYSIIYFVFCFLPTLPWSHCSDWWGAQDNCYVRGEKTVTQCKHEPHIRPMLSSVINASLATSNNTQNATTAAPCIDWESAGTQFWTKYILNLHPDHDVSNLGQIQWKVVISLIFSWILIFLCIGRGIKTSGKVVYVTAIFPYVVLIVLFVMGLTLEGSGKGLHLLFVPDFEKLLNIEVWVAAASQMFFSLNVAYGGIIMFSSYNKFQNKVKSDALLVTFMDTFTSVVASVVIFSILGNMAHTLKTEVDRDLVKSGPGLAFEIVPEAVLNLGIPHLWCALFMVMLITLAIDSEFAYIETFLTAIYDEFPTLRRHKVITCAATCTCSCLIGLSFTTQGGMYLLEFIDSFATSNCALFPAIFEMIAMFWIYGLRNFLDDTEFMLGQRPGYFWRVCWTILDPIVLILFFLALMASFRPKQFDGRDFPMWALALGWGMTVTILLIIPVYLVYYLIKYKRKGVSIRDCFKPSDDWGPSDDYIRQVYKDWKAKEPRPGTQQRSAPDFSGLVATPEALQPTDNLQTGV